VRDTDAPLPARANDVYRVRNVLGRETLYMNWGLWEPAIRDLDEAARTLVLQIGRLAQISPEIRLLDVGFGFGDQLLDWCRHSGLRHGEGINICPEQTEIARRRLASAGLGDRVRVQVADAVTLPFQAGSFDAVTAIECAFHFHTRERFFHEARRVLRPHGRLVLADFIGTHHPGRRQRLAQRMASKYWGFAPGSFCSAAQYRAMLEKVGFASITIEPVTARVIPPGMRYARRRLWSAEQIRRMQPIAWLTTVAALAVSWVSGDPLPGEYVLVCAEC
jgi:cyclopropane fatty-acyl-phospholipid synthase-like methyltransferase